MKIQIQDKQDIKKTTEVIIKPLMVITGQPLEKTRDLFYLTNIIIDEVYSKIFSRCADIKIHEGCNNFSIDISNIPNKVKNFLDKITENTILKDKECTIDLQLSSNTINITYTDKKMIMINDKKYNFDDTKDIDTNIYNSIFSFIFNFKMDIYNPKANEGDKIINEFCYPENSLTPTLQYAAGQNIIRLLNNKNIVILLTNSDYILGCINQSIRLFNIKENSLLQYDKLKKDFKLKDDFIFSKKNLTGLYIDENGIIKIQDTKDGIPFDLFGDIVKYMMKLSTEINNSND